MPPFSSVWPVSRKLLIDILPGVKIRHFCRLLELSDTPARQKIKYSEPLNRFSIVHLNQLAVLYTPVNKLSKPAAGWVLTPR